MNGARVERDEQPRPDTTIEKLASLRGAFGEGSTVTAGNAPGMNDGASAVLLMSAERARAAGLSAAGTLDHVRRICGRPPLPRHSSCARDRGGAAQDRR